MGEARRLQLGLAFGGNKTRKLELLAADALAQGCDTLVSIGGVQSNHTRQVAAVAAHLGLKCVLVQEHWVDWDDPGYERVGNILLSRIMGADVRLSDAGFDIAFRPSWEEALESVRAAAGTPYPIPAGASDHPLGGLGFARWADEVAEQELELGVFFDTVVVCSVTGSTQAGMVAGFAAQDRPRAVLGIDGSATVEQTRDQVTRIAQTTAEAIGLGASSTTARSCCSTSGTPERTGSPTRRPSLRSGCAPASRACSPTRCTKASRWLRSSTSWSRGGSSQGRGCSTHIWAGSRR